jgi:hypothetical protein
LDNIQQSHEEKDFFRVSILKVPQARVNPAYDSIQAKEKGRLASHPPYVK